MSYKQKLIEIEKLQDKIKSYGELTHTQREKINYKLRLDWNFYSNSIEGGTLTRSETRSIMIGNLGIDHKSKKHVLEMVGHDDVLKDIFKIGQSELRLSEVRIKAIHAAIIHEADPEKKELIGQWKKQDNEIIINKGQSEKINFLPFDEVPEAMHELLNETNKHLDWLTSSKGKNREKALHAVILAAEFHHKYLSIHPFYDGNGRTARILTNLILISCGYPAIIIKDGSEKDRYNDLLSEIKGYGQQPDLLYEFMAELVIRTQNLIVDALEGKDIEEPEDWRKQLMILDKEFEADDNTNALQQRFNLDWFCNNALPWISTLFNEIYTVTKEFDKFYEKSEHTIVISVGANSNELEFDHELATNELRDFTEKSNFNKQSKKATVDLRITFYDYKKPGLSSYNAGFEMNIQFYDSKFRMNLDKIDDDGFNKRQFVYTEKMLHWPVEKYEIAEIKNHWGKTLTNHLAYIRTQIKDALERKD